MILSSKSKAPRTLYLASLARSCNAIVIAHSNARQHARITYQGSGGRVGNIPSLSEALYKAKSRGVGERQKQPQPQQFGLARTTENKDNDSNMYEYLTGR